MSTRFTRAWQCSNFDGEETPYQNRQNQWPEHKEGGKVRKRMYSRPLIIATMLAVLYLIVGYMPASAQTFPATYKSMNFAPRNACGTADMPYEIQMVSGASGGFFSVPITSVTVPSCTLSYLVKGGDPARVTVQVLGADLPGPLVSALKQVVVKHARDFLNKARSCPYPAGEVFFNIVTPQFPLFLPILYYDGFEAFFPTVECGG